MYEKIALFEICRKQLQEEIVLKENPVFSEYDECTVNIDCQLDKLKNMLKLKKTELEKNLEYEQTAYGDYFAGMIVLLASIISAIKFIIPVFI